MTDDSGQADNEKAWQEELEKGAVETAEIVIQRRLLSTGEDAWRCTFTNKMSGELMPIVEIMGLLELAKDEAMQQHHNASCDECDEDED